MEERDKAKTSVEEPKNVAIDGKSRSVGADGEKPKGLAAGAEKLKKSRKGGWNLVLLGVAATLIATVTTGISLAIYHNSGDIYLDRSRPGYLPDEEEIEDEDENNLEYELDRTGKMTMDVLEEYLKNLDYEVRAVNAYEKPFNSDVLSDKQLGIPADKESSE